MQFRTTRICLLFALVLVLAAPMAQSQEWIGRGRAHGVIRDENDQPIEGAKVTLHLPGQPEEGPDPVFTDKKGRWAVGGLEGGPWTVIIEVEGYLLSEGSFNVDEFRAARPLVVNLTPIPKEDLIDQRAAEAKLQLDEGNTLLQEGKYAEARGKYEQALTNLEPEYHPLVLQGIASTYLGEENTEQALATLEQALALDPGNPDVLRAQARAYYQAGSVDRSIGSLQAIVAGNPDDVATMQLLIDLLVREGREEEAATYMAKLPEGQHLAPDTVLNTGIALYNNNDLDGALAQFDRAVEENPDLPDAYYYRGLVNLGKGNNEQAAADLTKFLELAPDHAKASEAREFLKYLTPE